MQTNGVLIVEDDSALRTLLVTLLTHRGFHIETAANGTEALERLERTSYSAVLLDLMMPVTSGFDLLQRFEATAPTMLNRTIVLTGVSVRDLRTVNASSVFAVVRKPFDVDDLVDTVKRCADHPAAPASQPGALQGLDNSLKQFEATLPALRQLLSAPVLCEAELMLRDELRHVVRELAGVLLSTASAVHTDGDRSERFQAAGFMASELCAMATNRNSH